MSADTVIEVLRAHQTELNDAGILSLSLFGSVARGESSPADVDLAAEFDSSKRLTLAKLSALQDVLTELVGAPVDLSNKLTLKSYVRQHAERDFLHVF